MIGYLDGELLNLQGNVALILNGGIGYEVTCSSSAVQSLTANGGGAIYTYLAVKEDGISLYGFSDLEEKELFLKLITVSGVGAKSGISILSEMDLNSLITAIATGDVKTISSIKGIGKKTAERIILELSDKVLGEGQTILNTTKTVSKTTEAEEEAISALVSLGFSKNESAKAVAEAKEKGADTLEKLMAYALKNIK